MNFPSHFVRVKNQRYGKITPIQAPSTQTFIRFRFVGQIVGFATVYSGAGCWDDVIAELRDFGDAYPTRRGKEADWLERRDVWAP